MRMKRRDLLWPGLVLTLVAVTVLFVWLLPAGGSVGEQELPPGIELYRTDVENVDCIVASDRGSGTIALSCTW